MFLLSLNQRFLLLVFLLCFLISNTISRYLFVCFVIICISFRAIRNVLAGRIVLSFDVLGDLGYFNYFLSESSSRFHIF